MKRRLVGHDAAHGHGRGPRRLVGVQGAAA